MLVALLAFNRSPAVGVGEPAGVATAQSGTIETPHDLLRGRTQAGLVPPVAVVARTAEPSAPPAALVAEGAGTNGGGTGAGGSGGGTAFGNQGANPSLAPIPTAVPTPFIDPQYLVHVIGRVVDGTTRAGLANVCISYGTLECSLAARTDATGNFDIPLDGRSSWVFRFIAPDYTATSLATIRLRPGPPINVGTVILRRTR